MNKIILVLSFLFGIGLTNVFPQEVITKNKLREITDNGGRLFDLIGGGYYKVATNHDYNFIILSYPQLSKDSLYNKFKCSIRDVLGNNIDLQYYDNRIDAEIHNFVVGRTYGIETFWKNEIVGSLKFRFYFKDRKVRIDAPIISDLVTIEPSRRVKIGSVLRLRLEPRITASYYDLFNSDNYHAFSFKGRIFDERGRYQESSTAYEMIKIVNRINQYIFAIITHADSVNEELFDW